MECQRRERAYFVEVVCRIAVFAVKLPLCGIEVGARTLAAVEAAQRFARPQHDAHKLYELKGRQNEKSDEARRVWDVSINNSG